MSRGQKRQYGGGGGYTEYYEQDFVGFRDNNNHHNNQTNQNFQGGGRSSGGWSGRGRGMRKHQQSRICYVNAEFINQHNTPDLQNLHGVRRRVGWASGGSGDNDASNNRYHLDNRIHNNNNNNANSSDIRLDDHCEDIFTDISVTVPSLINRRSEDETFDFGNGRQRVLAVRSTPAITGYNPSSLRKKKRRSEAEEQLETEVAVHRANHRRHKKSKRSKRNRGDEGNDSGGDVHLLSSPSDAEGDEDEDLRCTIVRQKNVRNNNFRREPGEILDTDESSSISSQKSEHKEVRKSSDASGNKSKKSSLSPKNNEDGKDTKTSTATSIRDGDLCPEVDDKVVELRPISAESLSQDTIASVASSVAGTNIPDDHSQGGCNTIENSRTNSPTNLRLSEDRNLGEALNSHENVTISAGLLDTAFELGPKKENENNINISNVQSPSSACSGGLFILESENTGLGGQPSSEIVVQRPASASAALEKRQRRGVLPFRKVTIRSLSPATAQDSQNKVHYKTSPGMSVDPLDSYWKTQTIRIKTEMASLEQQLNMKDHVINDLKRQVKLGEEKDAKIKVLRGRKTSMENEMEEIKKNMSKSEKRLKDTEQKLKKVELELKLKQEEVESLKRRDAEPANDGNKTDIQLIYALTYQDRLFVEVEKVKSSFEIEVLKLQEYYEARLAHYRNQGLHPGPFIGGPNNNFPKGCVMTPVTIGQPISVGHQSHNQEQNGMPRTESRSMQQQQMGLFAHLGNPDAVSPPLISIPQGISRTRLPVFLNPMMRRMQQGVEAPQLQPHPSAIQGMQHQNPNSSLLIPSTNSNSVNNNNSNQSNNNNNNSNNISPAAGGQNSAFSR